MLYIGIAVVVTSVLMLTTLIDSTRLMLSQKKIQHSIDRLEAFYTAELLAWHAHTRASFGEGNFSPLIDAQYSAGSYASQQPPSAAASSGSVQSVDLTVRHAPIKSLIRRYDPQGVGVKVSATDYCGYQTLMKNRYRLCLAGKASVDIPAKILVVGYGQYALNIDGRVFSWNVWADVCADPTEADTSAVSSAAPIVSLNAGPPKEPALQFFSAHIYAITSDGLLWWMEPNGRGLPFTKYVQPVNAQQASVAVSAASYNMLLGEDGFLYYREPPDLTFRAIEVAATERAGFSYLGDSNGGQYPCAIAKNGSVYCWQEDENGREGFVRIDLSRLNPGDIVRQLSSSPSTHCLLTQAGEAYCWAAKWVAQAGNMDILFRNEKYPSRKVDLQNVTGSKKIVFIQAPEVGLIITEEGAGYSWGHSATGNLQYCDPDPLKNGWCRTPVPSPVPIQIAHLPRANTLKWKTFRTTGSGACGVTDQKDVYCWGLPQDPSSHLPRSNPSPVRRLW